MSNLISWEKPTQRTVKRDFSKKGVPEDILSNSPIQYLLLLDSYPKNCKDVPFEFTPWENARRIVSKQVCIWRPCLRSLNPESVIFVHLFPMVYLN